MTMPSTFWVMVLPWVLEILVAVLALAMTAASLAESMYDLREIRRARTNGWKLLVVRHTIRMEIGRLVLANLLLWQGGLMLHWAFTNPAKLDLVPGSFFDLALAVALVVITIAVRHYRRVVLEMD